MTELEIIERARMYVDNLANGVNPIDHTVVPEGDIINNVRISRCLFFVSDVLRRVIENGGIKPKERKKDQRLPFEVPLERRQDFAYSEMPLTASEIARRVNGLVDTENMKKLTYSGILTWLTEIGMMEEVLTGEGKRTKRPNKIGIENGISVEDRTSIRGPYQVVVYNTAAQHFLIDHLDAIIKVENM